MLMWYGRATKIFQFEKLSHKTFITRKFQIYSIMISHYAINLQKCHKQHRDKVNVTCTTVAILLKECCTLAHLVKLWHVNDVSYAVFMTSTSLDQLQMMVLDPIGQWCHLLARHFIVHQPGIILIRCKWLLFQSNTWLVYNRLPTENFAEQLSSYVISKTSTILCKSS